MEAIKKIEELLRDDEEKAAKYKEALEAASEGSTVLEAVSAAAAAAGIEVTVEELERALAAAQELSDDDLSQVAGGAKHETFCGKDWYCFTAWHRNDEDDHDANCLADYKCLGILLHEFGNY